MILETPVVYAVENTYQIMFPVDVPAFAWIKIGDQTFEDAVCGMMRSIPGMRRISVPQELLDTSGGYTVVLQVIEERLSYHTKTLSFESFDYAFSPVPGENARAFMLGDAHGDPEGAVQAAEAFGSFDFLIVNGDIDECKSEERLLSAYRLASRLTGGAKPVVYVRGNHENRGQLAELLPNYIPLCDGVTYYTFRLGGIWGVVLDCGEDKPDDHKEYGGYARFHKFRLKETDFLRQVLSRAETEFAAAGVTHRICAVHTEFPRKQEEAFDIERELFQDWCDLLGEMGVEMILSAHMHSFQYLLPGDADLRLTIPCPLLIGTKKDGSLVGGSGLTFGKNGIEICYADSSGAVTRCETKGNEGML